MSCGRVTRASELRQDNRPAFDRDPNPRRIRLLQDELSQRLPHLVIDDAPQFARTEQLALTETDEVPVDIGRELQADPALGEPILELRNVVVDDLAQRIGAERAELHDLVDAIDEFRSQHLNQRLAHVDFRLRRVPGLDARGRETEGGAVLIIGSDGQVAGQDHDGLREVGGLAVGAGQATLIEDLQEQIEQL